MKTLGSEAFSAIQKENVMCAESNNKKKNITFIFHALNFISLQSHLILFYRDTGQGWMGKTVSPHREFENPFSPLLFTEC